MILDGNSSDNYQKFFSWQYNNFNSTLFTTEDNNFMIKNKYAYYIMEWCKGNNDRNNKMKCAIEISSSLVFWL